LSLIEYKNKDKPEDLIERLENRIQKYQEEKDLLKHERNNNLQEFHRDLSSNFSVIFIILM